MGLFSFLRKNKQESASGDNAFYSRAEEETKAMRSRSKRRQTEKGSKANNPVDPVLPEKKRARRRLIGAVALVLAAVIGLPMILDSEPRPVAGDIAIQIPSKEKTSPIANDHPANAESKVAASASLDAKEEVIEPAAIAQRAPPAKSTAQETRAADAAVSVPAKPKDEPRHDPVLAKTEPKPEPKSEPKAVDNASETARAMALLNGKPDPKAERKESGKFVIQVAALATKAKVDELRNRLKDAGIKSYTQKVATASGDRTRIRVGPFSSKEEAEKVRAKIVKLGLNGTLVPA